MSNDLKLGWSYKKLDELGFVGRGRSRHRPRNHPSLYGGPYPFFQTGDVKAAEFYLSDYSQTYNEKGLAQSKLWEPGTLCITIAANIAESAILKIKGCFPDNIVGFVADPDKADVRFVKYAIDTMKLRMQSISRGTTQDNLSLDKLLTFDFLTPPLPTQRKIAAILSAYDDLIENNTRRIAILEEMARLLYREWFVHFRFPGHEQVAMVDSELGPIPEGWEVVKLGSIADNEDMQRLLEEAELDDVQETALARVFSDEYQVITRDDRLEKVAEDIVSHFVNRGYPGKAMIVSIDKLTTMRMYDRVQKYWHHTLDDWRAQLAAALPEARDALAKKIEFMETTDMAVVLSQEQGEVEKFREKGLDIVPHRQRMMTEDLDEKFKDPDDPFRLVFVCAMWRTGFDVPSCSTIYLDRPMRNHTLMQTIARANRVFGEKVNGLIVDYVGIFRDLQRALAIYGTGPDGQIQEGEEPIEDKDALVERLRETIAEAEAFCADRGVDLEPILQSEGFQRIALMDAALSQLVEAQAEAALDDSVERIIVNDELKSRYLALAGEVDRLFKAILPDTRAGEFSPRRKVFVVLADKIRGLAAPADITEVMGAVEDLLDESVEAKEYVIREPGVFYDLSKVDFEALRQHFEQGRKRTEAEKLRSTVSAKLRRMVRLNRSRMNYLEEFQRIIDEYNAGSRNVEEFFEALVEFARRLNEEDQRAIAENLSEEELAVFDILTRPDLNLTEKEKRAVKQAAHDLLETLKREKLVLDWRKRQQSRAAVRVLIEELIWQLPERYTDKMCQQKSAQIYQHIYDNYWGPERSIYAMTA